MNAASHAHFYNRLKALIIMKRITDLKNRCEQLMLHTPSEKPVIAVCGLMNVGKSYLLNMLTQHIDREYFKTADQRETTTNKTLETENYIYLDTPGLDANTQDDAIAKQGISQADIVLFVHQPQGELEAAEMDFLRQLKNSYGKAFKHSVVIVISKIDKEDLAKINSIDAKIQEQCQQHLGAALTSIQISNLRYQKGVREQKNVLIQASHIDALVQHLKKITQKVRQTRSEKIASTIEMLLSETENAIEEMRHEKRAIQREISEKFSHFNQQMDQLQSFLNESTSNFKQI